ncbi:MAG: isoamylase early set domain-containing protein [Nitrospira sp.]
MAREQRRHGLFNSIALLSVLVTFIGTGSCTKTIVPEPPRVTPGGVKFTISAPGAKDVCLVGTFNGWVKRATPMARVNGTLWSVVMPLKEGEYAFMYVIDEDQWVTPPQADDFVTDGFGQTNGVVVVR